MGPLGGLTIIEIAGIGPGPFCAMMLADMGAHVVRIDRADRVITPGDTSPAPDFLNRGRRSVGVDLKHPRGRDVVLRLAEQANGLIEGFRPGVAERLGIGPEPAMERNPRIVYGRMTGWGQTGPRASTAGHDIDYLAVAGVLGSIGPADEPPVPPLNLIADFGGGGMLLAFGMVCGILEAQRSGIGQVIDAAMVDGSAVLSTMIHALAQMGIWTAERGRNLLDGGAPFYASYETADGRHMAVGALEPQFFSALLAGLGLDADDIGEQYDRAGWPHMRVLFAERFAAKTRDEWERTFAGTDACVAPVRALTEAYGDDHLRARGTFVEAHGHIQPAPAPRFGRTAAGPPAPAHHPGSHTDAVLADFGWTADEIDDLHQAEVIR